MYKEKAEKAIELVRTRVGNAPGFDGRSLLLFSGGRDSSAVAAAFCAAFPQGQLHLLLIDNGLLSRLESTARQVNLLRTLFPGYDLVFETKRVSQMMRQVAMQEVEKDFMVNGYSTLLVCLACKLIMNVSATKSAAEAGIKIVLDGFADRQKKYPEQTEEAIESIRQLYKEVGLIYLSPLYDFLTDKSVVNETLAEFGVYIPKQEPICMWADSFSVAKSEEIPRYIKKTLELIFRYDPVFNC